MSLLEVPCAKTSWRAPLFHAILGITGALIVCFWHMTVWTSQQQWNRFWWPPLWFWATHAMFNCACVYEFRKVCIRGAQRFYFVGALLFLDNVQTHLGTLLLGRALLIRTLPYSIVVFVVILWILMVKLYVWKRYIHIKNDITSCYEYIKWCPDSVWVMRHVINMWLIIDWWLWLYIINNITVSRPQCMHSSRMRTGVPEVGHRFNANLYLGYNVSHYKHRLLYFFVFVADIHYYYDSLYQNGPQVFSIWFGNYITQYSVWYNKLIMT